MAITTALEYVYNAVAARFAAEGTAATNVFGWREPARQPAALASPLAHGRIVWTPGDATGSLGELKAARNPGRDPRPLATLGELVTCTISAADLTAPESELAQYRITRLLYDAWFRAVYLAFHGQFAMVSQGWVEDANERRRGAAIRAVISLDAMIADLPATLAPADTSVCVTVTELNVTDPAYLVPTPLSPAP